MGHDDLADDDRIRERKRVAKRIKERAKNIEKAIEEEGLPTVLSEIIEGETFW